MPRYEIYTTEIMRGHTLYYITAESRKEALEKFQAGEYDDTPYGDTYDSEIIDIEIYEN